MAVLASVGGFGNHVPGRRNEDGVGPFGDNLRDIVEQQVTTSGQPAAEVGDEITWISFTIIKKRRYNGSVIHIL